MIQNLFQLTRQQAVGLGNWVNRRLWLEMVLAASIASALMAVVSGLLVLSQSARQLRHNAEDLQRQLSVGLTSYEPLHNLQRRLQQASSGLEVEMALVLDQRGFVLAASDNALVGQPLTKVLQRPEQAHLRELFAECPSFSSLLSCLTREEVVFQGPVPWIGGEALMTMRQYPLALEGLGRFGDRGTLITITDVRPQRLEVLLFILQMFAAGLLPLLAGCLGLMVLLRRELIPELLKLAQIDALSGIYNRRAFHETAAQILAQAEQRQLPVTLALIDVDHFKRINDTFGHDAGDAVIRAVSELLRSAVRSVDLVGRIGGDEFAVLSQLPGATATAILDRARVRIQATGIRMLGAVESDAALDSSAPVVEVNLSIGVACSSGSAGYGLAELISAADAALYVAKDRGRAQVVNLEEEQRGSRPSRSGATPLGEWQVGGI
ncbi:MAG: GGDEF domain-containing protein [Chitinophagaceae bacterium]|nr:GGDEF domain-containing protein [Chitinophagaceae bacterium]